MKFELLCDAFEKICLAPKDKKKKIFYKLINSSRESSISLGTSFFSLARLLLPKLDTERGPYGVKEYSLAKTYIRILCLPKDGPDANKLIKFRSPASGSLAGDFADVAYWILKSRCRSGGKLSVQDVNAHLDKIASLHASNKPRCVDDELTAILFNMSAEEQKWLIRLLLKDLRLGIGQTTILNAIHPDAKELYDASNNLRKVCERLQDPNKRLHEIDVTLFQPCRPMLSERLDVLKIESIMSKASFFYVEKKHDGERFQLHIDHGSFRYFSREGKDYSKNFGETRMSGVLTPLLAKQLHANVQACILDGEMMGWHPKLKCFGSKGMNFDVKYLKDGDLYRPCFCVFDVLMLNGDVLTNKTVQDRIEILHKMFVPLEGVFMNTPRKCAQTSLEIVEALNNAIDNQEEGLIVKNPSSIYKPAARTGGWYKIKPEYTVGLTDELDLLIIGGYFGEGRRKSNISHFLLGVAVSSEAEGKNPLEFHSVGRVGSGYSNKELAELLEKLSPHWEVVKGTQMPHGIFWAKERPDLWIEPRHSQMLQVKATEIVKSDHYKTGFTLRFPRVEKIRYDKKWSECCTTSDFEKMRLSNCGKLASKHVSSSELINASPTKRQRIKAAPTVGQDYQAADLTSTTQRSGLLNGREICVLSGNEKMSKQNLEKGIHELGGTVVQHRGPETFCVVAGKRDFRLKNLLDKCDIDVVTVDWLVHVLSNERLLDWEPKDLLAMSSKTLADMELKYDNFYDSFHKPTNIDALKCSLEKVYEQGSAVNLLPSEMGDLDIEVFSGMNEFAVFRCCTAHFVASNKEEEAFTCSLLKAMFIFQGGCISEIESSDVTHVVIMAHDSKTLSHFQDLNQSRAKKFHIVVYDWIESCWVTRRRLHEADFHPKSPLYSK